MSDAQADSTATDAPPVCPRPGSFPAAPDASRQTRVVRDHFQRQSSEWGDRYERAPQRMSDLDLQLRRENVQALLAGIVARADGTLRLFDIGCGTGDVLAGFPRTAINVVGMDLVPEMLSVAAARHKEDRFLAGSISALPLAPQRADVVISLGVLEYLPDPARALRHIRELLRPEGALIISFPNRHSLFRSLRPLESGIESALLRLRAWLRRKGAPSSQKPAYAHASWSVAESRRVVATAGFELVDTRVNTYGPWGRLGRTRFALRLSQWLSRRWCLPGVPQSYLASTIVICARRAGDTEP